MTDNNICENCGELEALHGSICGRCYIQDEMEKDMQAIKNAQEMAQEQTDLLGEIMEGIGEGILQTTGKAETVHINKQGVETTIEVNGETYGISFMIKRLNEAEKEAWETAVDENN